MTTATLPLQDLTAHQRAALKKKAARSASALIVKHLLDQGPSDLSERARVLLFNMTLHAALGGDFGRYFEPLELGGKTKSDHSATLDKLTSSGLVERINRNFLFGRPSYLYRPAVAPQVIHQLLRHEFDNLVESLPSAPTL